MLIFMLIAGGAGGEQVKARSEKAEKNENIVRNGEHCDV